jgi:hemolysin activation/secretion protein
MWLDGQMLNTVGYEYKRSTDYVNDILTYGKKIDSIHLKSVQTGYLSGRLNVLGDLALGNLEYDHDGFLYPFDEKLIHAEYDFAKLNLEAQFEQPITRQSQLIMKARGQYASKNLDSLEKISITGINGVRAYNSDVGTGDEGLYGGVEFRKFFSVMDFQLQASVFYDIGQVRVAKNQYYSSINEGTFQGVGVGLTVRSGNFIFQTTYSESVGSSPLNTNDAKRLWSVATVAF